MLLCPFIIIYNHRRNEMTKKLLNDNNFLKIFLFISVFLVGGYHLVSSCFLSVMLLAFLLFKTLRQKDYCIIKPNAVLITTFLVVFSYLVVTVWAIDKGTAIYGFFKFLPVGLFAAILSIYDKKTREDVVDVIPYAAASNGVLAFVLSLIPTLSDHFLVAERLGGFFQSPNAFAVFCLAGVVVLLTAEKLDVKNLVLTAILVVLIFLSGSRTVFVFLVVAIAVLVFKIKNKKMKFAVLGIILLVIVSSVVVVFATGNVQTVGRFLTISMKSSTLLGRLLYYKDALPIILEHPFGLGYYGYYFTQGSFQTGVYSVAFVHNSVLQFILDVGFIPAIAFVILVVTSFFSKNTSFRQRMIIFVIFGHSLVDFDLEFISIFITLILVLDFDLYEKNLVKINSAIMVSISVVLILFSAYFGVVNAFYLSGEYKTVDKIYGHDSMSKMHIIITEDDKGVISRCADEMIEENGCLAIAYDVKANEAFEVGDFKRVIDYKNKAIEYAPYSIEEYTDFCKKLLTGVMLYTEHGDINSARVCKKELISIKHKLENVKRKTSKLAWEIKDRPQLDLPEEYVKMIEEYEEIER